MEDFLLKLKPGDVFITLVDNWEKDNVSIEIFKTLAVGVDSNVFVDRVSYYLSDQLDYVTGELEYESEKISLMIDVDYFLNNGNLFIIDGSYWDLVNKAHNCTESEKRKIFNQVNNELQVLIKFMEENL